jgi:hypothetical protein
MRKRFEIIYRLIIFRNEEEYGENTTQYKLKQCLKKESLRVLLKLPLKLIY